MERFIAEGGMATVFLAVQKSLNRRVALKILKKFDTPAHAERFLREGRTIASLNHRNIITIHDIGVIDDRHYISMEYLEGGSLSEKINAGMQEPEILDLMQNICCCLDFVHRKGIVHRDIKPSNILFHTDGTAKLTDFGIAKQLNNDQDLTIDGSAFGSPYYLSPEQAEGQTLDGRTDIYALGIIFHEMLTGQKPFAEKSHIETILAHLTHPIPKLPKAFSKYQVLMERMIAKDPGDRATSAQELLELIQKIRHCEAPSLSEDIKPRKKDLSRDWARSLAVEWGKRFHPSCMTRETIIEWGKRLRLPSMTQGGIGERWKRLQLSPMTQKGIAVSALLLLAAGTGIPLYGHLSQQDHAVTVESLPVNDALSVEVTASAEEVSVSAAGIPSEETAEDPDPVEEVSGALPLTVPSDISTTVAVPAKSGQEEPDKQSLISESLKQPADKTALKYPKEEKAPAPAVDEKAAAIRQSLEAGDRALKAYRLTTPSEDNAYSHYQNVLKIDPGNIGAKAGIKKVAEIYAQLSRKELNKGNYRLARVYLRRGSKMGPGYATWSQLGAEISKQEESSQKVAELKQQDSEQDKKEKKPFSERFKNFWKSLQK